MTIGLGVFLAALFLGSIYFYRITRDRWNWQALSKWLLSAVISIAMIVIAVSGGVYFYGKIRDRPQDQNEYAGLGLGMTMKEVKYAKGSPADVYYELSSKPQVSAKAWKSYTGVYTSSKAGDNFLPPDIIKKYNSGGLSEKDYELINRDIESGVFKIPYGETLQRPERISEDYETYKYLAFEEIPSGKSPENYNNWIYGNSAYSEFIEFDPTSKTVSSIMCVDACPSIMGVDIGTEERAIKRSLGTPSHEEINSDNGRKTITYKNYSVRFGLEKGKVVSLGIQNFKTVKQ